VTDNYKEALNLRQAYIRERADVRSAAGLALGDKAATADIVALEQTLSAAEPIDVNRVKIAYHSAAVRLKVAPVDPLVPSEAERTASRTFPSRKPGVEAQPQGPPGQVPVGQPPAALINYYAMEARNFADGRHSLLDIRNALSAEFGPVSLDDVTKFFRDLESSGSYVLAERR
jgi:hypothetical protein